MTLSKAIRQEFLAVFFRKAVFVFECLDFAGGCLWKRERIPFIDQVLNVGYVTSLFPPGDMLHVLDLVPRDCTDRRVVEKIMSETTAKPLEFFKGTGLLRNSCSIELRSAPARVMPVLQSPLLIAIKGLSCFRTVTLKLVLTAWRLSKNEIHISDGRILYSANYIQVFRRLAHAFCRVLEPSLGPSIISENRDIFPSWELTFRPQDYIANRDKVKAISSRSGDEENESFP